MVVAVASQLREEHAGATKAPAFPAPGRHLKLVPGQDALADITPYRGTELCQARQFYDPVKIAELADSIDDTELINAVEIAQLDEAAASYYLRVWNRVWHQHYGLSDLSRGPDGCYEIVVDGHCRRRAGIKLCEEGRPPAKWPVRFLRNISPEQALNRQFQENIHSKPLPWEDAESIYNYWVFLQCTERERQEAAEQEGREYRSELTLVGFARRVGRADSTVEDYVRFGEAPAVIQTAVRQRKIAYGLGIILARAVKSGAISRAQLEDHWLPLAAMPGQPIDVFEKAMEARIQAARNQQEDLFGDLSVDAVLQAYQNDRRAIVLPEHIRRIHENVAYLEAVRELDEAGKFGADGPYSEASPNRVLQKFVDELERTLPHLRGLVEQKRQHSSQVIAEASALLSELGEPAPRQTEALFA